VLGGTTIVVSPLIALMQDQVQGLVAKGISAAIISSNNTERQNNDIMERLLGRKTVVAKSNAKSVTAAVGPLKPITLLYVTPEQVQTNRFREILKEIDQLKRLTMFAIDEAVSPEWFLCVC
jgi:superfamily II DNA helicase RecQ